MGLEAMNEMNETFNERYTRTDKKDRGITL